MKVFLSYRRTDQYLARLVRDGLLARRPGTSVFLDVESIELGDDVERTIEAAIGSADVVVVLVGPAWQPERLADEDDYVRLELELASQRAKRILPAVHSGATMPGAHLLPSDLRWFSRCNALTFGAAVHLDDDLDGLDASLTQRTPALAELRQRVWGHYEHKEDDQIAAAAEEAWSAHRATPSPALADVCRTAAIALARLPVDHPDHLLRHLWMARAQSTAFQAGASNTLAASLLPPVFALLEAGRPAAARGVLDEVDRLTVDGPGEFPTTPMMRRISHEKRAFTFLVEGRIDDARGEYELALPFAEGDPWSLGKVLGSVAICDYLDGRHAAAIDGTRRVLELASRHGHEANVEAASTNLAVMASGRGTLVPYEVIVDPGQLHAALTIGPA